MKTNKMRWNKPELLVLTRSNPEEAVLATCKAEGGVPNNGPQGKTCGEWTTGGNPQQCQESSLS